MTSVTRFTIAAVFVAALSAGVPADQQGPSLGRVMRTKLDHAQAILAAVITSDWSALDRRSRALAMAVRDPAWQVPMTEPEYIQQSDAFGRALQDLIEASAKRDLAAAGRAQVSLTTTCVQCHLYMTRLRIAK